MKFELHELKGFNDDFSVDEEFWCNCCDGVIVDSKDPTTGKFFLQWGHMYKANSNRGWADPEFHPFIFAVCHECLRGESE
jgi:hypothetical protein